MLLINDDERKVSIDVTDSMKEEVFNRIVQWCREKECFFGEVLMQDDDCIISSPVLLSDIIDDVLKFDVKYD